MEKLALQLASVASMIDQFNMSNIQILKSLGYKVDVVADFTNPGTISHERSEDLKRRLNAMDVEVYDVAIPRTLNPVKIIQAYRQVRSLIYKKDYSLLHCHSPIGGVIARAAARGRRKEGLKVIYTAHGFHFYDGAPIKNWLIFYPIEKWFSRYTDTLITINNEDYNRAKKKFHSKKTIKIPGVGVDTSRFDICKVDAKEKRSELGVRDTDFLVLLMKSCSDRYDLKVIINALYRLKQDGDINNIVCLIVGKYDQEEEIKQLLIEYDLIENIRFLGSRTDEDEICETVDCYINVSFIENNLALFEACAAGLPIITANNDYAKAGISGWSVNPTNIDDMAVAIKKMYQDKEYREKCASNNRNVVKTIDFMSLNISDTVVSNGGYSHLMSILIRQKMRREFGLGLNDFVLISVGELNENKNHQLVIRAIKDIPSIKYVIVGKGPLQDKLIELSEQMGVKDRVYILGYRTDIRDLLWMSDCFAFPSKREGLGLAAIEGLSAGLPVVASDVGGICDYTSSDTGHLCDGHSVEEYSTAIRNIMNTYSDKNYYDQCRAKAKCFDISITNQKMVSVYDDRWTMQ